MRVVPLLPFIQDLREIKNISCIQWSNNEHNPKLHVCKEIC